MVLTLRMQAAASAFDWQGGLRGCMEEGDPKPPLRAGC